jgi:hypothetical protein
MTDLHTARERMVRTQSRLLDERALAAEIADMEALARKSYPRLHVTQDLGLGMMLWMSPFFAARAGRARSANARSRPSTACGSIRPGISAASHCYGT